MLRPSRLPLPVRIGRLLASWLLVALGVPLLVRADLGVAPFDVLNTGVADLTGWSFGLIFVLDGLVCFVIGALLGAPPGPASWLGGVVIGPLINVSLGLLPEPAALVPRIGMLGLGILVIGLAICLVVSTDLGAGPTEVIMLGMIKRRIGIIPSRVVSDGVPLALGVVLGGALGVGTVAFLLAMGPIVRFGLRRLHYVPVGLAPTAA